MKINSRGISNRRSNDTPERGSPAASSAVKSTRRKSWNCYQIFIKFGQMPNLGVAKVTKLVSENARIVCIFRRSMSDPPAIIGS